MLLCMLRNGFFFFSLEITLLEMLLIALKGSSSKS